MNIVKSSRAGKKYMVLTPKGKVIHFGDSNEKHFRDKLGLYTDLDHNDRDRQRRYLARATKIRNGQGELTKDDPESANFYSLRYLWDYK
jgi:hypothetical protein